MTDPVYSPAAGGGPPSPGASAAGPAGGTTPPAEPLHGAHDTYPKGEIGSIGALISDIATDMSTLVRQELELAKAEAKESATQAGKGAGMLAGAGVAAHVMAIFATAFLMFVLAELFDSLIWAALVVTLLWAVAAATLAVLGRNQLKRVRGLPQTTETVKAVPDAISRDEDRA